MCRDRLPHVNRFMGLTLPGNELDDHLAPVRTFVELIPPAAKAVGNFLSEEFPTVVGRPRRGYSRQALGFLSAEAIGLPGDQFLAEQVFTTR